MRLAELDEMKAANGDTPSPFNGWCSEFESSGPSEADDLETYEPDRGVDLPSDRFFGR